MFQFIYDLNPVALNYQQILQYSYFIYGLFITGWLARFCFKHVFIDYALYALSLLAAMIWLEINLYWYGIAYVFSFFIGKYIVERIAGKDFSVISLLNYIVLGVIIGGKLGSILLYEDQMINLRAGMSFHGGFIGAAVTSWLFAKQNSQNFLKITDLIALVAPIGLFCGRIANAINNEILGKVSTGWFSVINYGVSRHPVSVYQAISEGIVLGWIMLYARKQCKIDGMLTSVFTVTYAILRFISEHFKSDDLFSISVFSIVIFALICIIFLSLLRDVYVFVAAFGLIWYMLAYRLLTIGQIISILMFISGCLLMFAVRNSVKSKKEDNLL